MRIHWDSRFLTGNEEVDRQHREMYQKIDLLVDACYRGEPRDFIENAINVLELSIVEHFRSEEKLLGSFKVPDIDAHIQEHQDFIGHIARLKKMFDASDADYAMAIDTINTLIGWTGHHILSRDKVFCRFVQVRAEFE
jgi:hemerythrin